MPASGRPSRETRDRKTSGHDNVEMLSLGRDWARTKVSPAKNEAPRLWAPRPKSGANLCMTPGDGAFLPPDNLLSHAHPTGEQY